MATILSLPNEILALVVSSLDAVADIAAVALTTRRLSSTAHPLLYAAAACNDQCAGRALFYSIQHGFVPSIRRLLLHGVDPRITAISTTPLDPFSPEFSSAWPATTLFYHPHSDLPVPPQPPGSFHALDHSDFDDSDSASQASPGLALRRRLIRSRDYFQWSALHLAAASGQDGIVTLLLDAGAEMDPLLRCWDRRAMQGAVEQVVHPSWDTPRLAQTPLGAAISTVQRSTAELLLTRGASTSVSDDGITALHSAAWHGDLELCMFLVDKVPHLVHAQTTPGFTPFHYAAAAGHVETVGRFLQKMGANIRLALNEGAFVLRRLGRPQPRCDSLTQALRRGRYATATALLDLDPAFATPAEGVACPLEACLNVTVVRQGLELDRPQMATLFERLFRPRGQLDQERSERLLAFASSFHIPQAVGLLLEAARDPVFSNRVMDAALADAFSHVQSPEAVETVMALVNYRVTVLGLPSPGLTPVFTAGSTMRPRTHGPDHHNYNLDLTKPGVLEIVLELARRIHDGLVASPGGVDPEDLRNTFPAACQPGGLKVCQWLADLGALDRMDEGGFLNMLSGAAMPPAAGGNDPALAEWVLAQAAKKGHLDWVLSHYDAPEMIVGSGAYATAIAVVRAGSGLASPPPGQRRGLLRFPAFTRRPTWPCLRIQRGSRRRFNSEPARHVLVMACAQPYLEGAEELLRLAVDRTVAGEDPGRVINCALFVPDCNNHIFTPASLVCSTFATKTERGSLEPTRLAMLKILLAAGAEVHATVACTQEDIDADTEYIEQHDQTESLRSALAWERMKWDGPGTLPPLVFLWRNDPVRSAIRSLLPTLVRAVLEARPLPAVDSPSALLYLRTACGTDLDGHEGRLRQLCPGALEAVLDLANLSDPNVGVGFGGEPPLTLVVQFFAFGNASAHDFDRGGHDHDKDGCDCGAGLRETEARHLADMVAVLLRRGAKWRDPELTGYEPLQALRALSRSDVRMMDAYRQHNVAYFRKHVVLDVYSERAWDSPGFNPFEMGDIKATMGTG